MMMIMMIRMRKVRLQLLTLSIIPKINTIQQFAFKDKLLNDYDIKTIKINANVDINNIGKDPKQIKVNTPISIDILKHYVSSFYAKDGSKSIKITVDNKIKSL